MKTRIIAPFAVSVVAFIFAYFFWKGDESFIVLLFIGIGIVLAGFGVYFAARDK